MGVLLTAAAIAASVGAGVWAEQRRPDVAAKGSRQALLVVLYGFVPVVVFFNLAASNLDLAHGVGLLVGIVSIAVTALFAGLIASRFLDLRRDQVGAVICAVLAVNSAYMGYPLTVALLGREELSTAVLFDVLVCAPALLLGAFAVGAAFGTRAGESPRERVHAFFARNPPLYAAIAGLLAPPVLAPDFLVDASQTLVIAILPVGFFAVGATLAENAESGKLPMPPRLSRPVILAVVSRLAIAPALLIALSAPLVDLPSAYLLVAAMPTGVYSMVVAHAYGLDLEIIAEAVAWSTAIVIVAALGSLLF